MQAKQERTDARAGEELLVGAAASANSVERVGVKRHRTHLLFEVGQPELLRVVRIGGGVVRRRRLAAVACASEEAASVHVARERIRREAYRSGRRRSCSDLREGIAQ